MSSDRTERIPSPRARRGSRLLAISAVAVAAGAAAWAWQANFGAAARPAMDMRMRATVTGSAFPVTVASVQRGTMRGTVVYTGSVAPHAEEDVYPRVTGRIVEMPVYPGDAIRVGQLVARLDDVELSSRAQEAAAMVAVAQANRAQMNADLAAARHGIVQMDKEVAMVEAELGNARSVAARSERLFGVGAVSRQEYESDRSMAAALEAKRDAARARLDQARAMEASALRKLEAAESMVAQTRAALRTATVVRDYVNIVAPTSGRVVKRLVAPGVLVQPGMAILKVAHIDRVRLQANVGERDLAGIRLGSPVTVTLAANGQPPLTARVSALFPFVEPGGRTAVVEAVVDNPGHRLLPGQYVAMQFVTGERNEALTVPSGTVVRMGGRATVWVVRDGHAEPREVVVGLESADRVEILRGLEVDERVVSRGRDGLYAGARVAEAGPGTPPVAAGSDPAPPAAPGKPKEASHAGH